MQGTINSKRTRLTVVSAVLLLVGLAGSLAVYVAAEQDPEGTPAYEIVGGHIYPSRHERSKKYVHDLELYGGKAAVLADDINRCFDGLWHGTALAYTLACLTVMVSGGIFLAARHSRTDSESGTPDGSADDGS
jgi:hypothetical protein